MLWNNYVFRRGQEVQATWDNLYKDRRLNNRQIDLLYIAGGGFDDRGQQVMKNYVESISGSACEINSAECLLIRLDNYEIDEGLRTRTVDNIVKLKRIFDIGNVFEIHINAVEDSEEDDSEPITSYQALHSVTTSILNKIGSQTDIILDISSMPRTLYLSLMLGILKKLLPEKNLSSLESCKITFQILVGENPNIDSAIHATDLRNELTLIPGYSNVMQTESRQDWPIVWFPILGENRLNQFRKILTTAISDTAEICPVLPHPSSHPRRGDNLLIEYREPLAETKTPVTNILYVHEANPFEAYRQILGAMNRYKDSMCVVGGCKLVVSPLASKLITIGVGLACFEMQPNSIDKYGVAIPCAEPKRYAYQTVTAQPSTKTELATLILSGDVYSQ